MIENLFENMTPHLVNGKKLYDEQEIKKAVSKLIQQAFTPEHFNSLGLQLSVKEPVEQYSEATC